MKKKKENIFIVGLFLIAIILLFVYIKTTEHKIIYNEFKHLPNGSILIEDKAKIIFDDGKYYEGQYLILGILENTSKRKIEYVTIEYTLYDKDNMVIDKVYDTTDEIGKGKDWQFVLVYDGKRKNEVTKYKLTRVTFY